MHLRNELLQQIVQLIIFEVEGEDPMKKQLKCMGAHNIENVSGCIVLALKFRQSIVFGFQVGDFSRSDIRQVVKIRFEVSRLVGMVQQIIFFLIVHFGEVHDLQFFCVGLSFVVGVVVGVVIFDEGKDQMVNVLLHLDGCSVLLKGCLATSVQLGFEMLGVGTLQDDRTFAPSFTMIDEFTQIILVLLR